MSDARKILIVEDEVAIRDGLVSHLQGAGHRVQAVGSVAEGVRALVGAPDLVILDRRLPDGEGLDVLRAARRAGHAFPFLVLSARGMPEDRVEGLEHGADDYVAKPFHLRELVARVNNLLARGAGGRAGVTQHTFGPFTLDIAARTLTRGKTSVALTKLEFDLLAYLLRHRGRAVPRAELLDRVWGYDRYPTTRTVDYHVLALRKKIEAGSPPKWLLTVQGVGYRFAE